jgi:hypothetical protein
VTGLAFTLARLAVPPLAAVAGTLIAGVAAVVVSPVLVLPVIAVTLLVAVALGWSLEPDPAPPSSPPATPPAAGVAAVTPDPRQDALVAAHLDLARAMLDVRDLTASPNAVARADRALADAGVTPLSPAPGTRFDHRTQFAAGAVATDDPALDDTVAEVLVQGSAIGTHVVRQSQVSVYRTRLSSEAGHD